LKKCRREPARRTSQAAAIPIVDDDAAFDAAFIAQTLGRTMRAQWMRENELPSSPFGSASPEMQSMMVRGRIPETAREGMQNDVDIEKICFLAMPLY